MKAPLEYSRGTEKTWVYGALRVRDGEAITFTAASRHTAGHLKLLERIAAANPTGAIYVIGDNRASHTSPPVQAWLEAHPRVEQVFIPKGASWLNLQEPWWRLLRREAYAGQTFADAEEIAQATATATTQLNARAKSWVWGRPPPTSATTTKASSAPGSAGKMSPTRTCWSAGTSRRALGTPPLSTRSYEYQPARPAPSCSHQGQTCSREAARVTA